MLFLDYTNSINDFKKNLELMKTPFFNNFQFEYENDVKYNMYENEDGTYLLEMVVPGYTKNEIDIIQDGEYLKIKGSREPNKNNKILQKGYDMNNFEKIFRLKRGSFVKSAELNNGLLMISIGLPEEEQRKKIEIN